MMKVVPSTLLRENSSHKNKTLLQIYIPNENLKKMFNDFLKFEKWPKITPGGQTIFFEPDSK